MKFGNEDRVRDRAKIRPEFRLIRPTLAADLSRGGALDRIRRAFVTNVANVVPLLHCKAFMNRERLVRRGAMKPNAYLFSLVILPLVSLSAFSVVAATAEMAPKKATVTAELPKLPPAPKGVTDLRFEDLFQMPVGDYGLEFTAKVKTLDGKKVRIVGYMVHEEVEKGEEDETGVTLGKFMLTPRPASVNYAHYGLCEDLPPQTVYVTAPDLANKPVAFTHKPLALIGTLSIGTKEEPFGRISAVRITLDPEPVVVKDATK